MTKFIVFLFLFWGSSFVSVAQNISNAEKTAALSKEAFKAYYLKNHSRTGHPQYTVAGPHALPSGLKRAGTILPKNLSVAGEFEEMQGVFVTWPYVSYDTAGNMVELTFDDYFLAYDAAKNKEVLVKVAESIPDTFANSPMPAIYRELIHYIENEAVVYINIFNAQDSFIVKRYMNAQGLPLHRYKFLIHKGNSIWYRDCGPIPFYYSANDSIGFLNFEYYGGRPLDDDLPLKWGQDLNYPVFTNTIEWEAGNMLTDGAGTLFTSSAVSLTNGDPYGQVYLDKNQAGGFAYRSKKSLSKTALTDSFKRLLNMSNVQILPMLQYDGGTGHIDLYADMTDDGTIITTDYPSVLNKTSFPDYAIVMKNTGTIKSMLTNQSKNYQNYKIPFPTKDNGSWYTDGPDYEDYTRTYSNHLVINKTIVQPIFSNTSNGNAAGDAEALKAIQKQFPGYKIQTIDMRAFDGYGGLIHCITMHLPAENPIRILHYPVRYFQSPASAFKISAKITNKSGIQTATCQWRMKGATQWNALPLVSNGTVYEADIPGNSNAIADTIEYYIEASSNNGKTIQRPMTAPQGYYTFFYGSTVVGIPSVTSGQSSFNLYPNPASGYVLIDFQTDKDRTLEIRIYDAMGKEIKNLNNVVVGKGLSVRLNTQEISAGVYTIEIISESCPSRKKLVIE